MAVVLPICAYPAACSNTSVPVQTTALAAVSTVSICGCGMEMSLMSEGGSIGRTWLHLKPAGLAVVLFLNTTEGAKGQPPPPDKITAAHETTPTSTSAATPDISDETGNEVMLTTSSTMSAGRVVTVGR